MNKSKVLFPFTLSLIIFFCYSCNLNEDTKNNIPQLAWENLVDSELTNWDTYLSFKHKDTYDGTVPMDGSNQPIEPIGLNKPGYQVFTTIKEADETLIKVSGEYYGCIATKKEYENYHFQLKYKWGEKKVDS